jgi:hypothetical protein
MSGVHIIETTSSGITESVENMWDRSFGLSPKWFIEMTTTDFMSIGHFTKSNYGVLYIDASGDEIEVL